MLPWGLCPHTPGGIWGKMNAGGYIGGAPDYVYCMKKLLALFCLLPGLAFAEGLMIDDFRDPARWQFFTDQVMGGVSTGNVQVTDGVLRLTGDVSTANRGGFIQARLDLPDGLAADAAAFVITVRGNGAGYFLHVRTRGALLPWQYYQAPFATSGEWTQVRVPLTVFQPSGALLRDALRPQDVRSVAVVAYGRDYRADLELRALTVE